MKILPCLQSFLLFVPELLLIPLHFFEIGKPKQKAAPGKVYTHVCMCKYIPEVYTATPSLLCPFSRAFSIQWGLGLVFRASCALRRNFHATLAEAYALLPICIWLIEILSSNLPCLALSMWDEQGIKPSPLQRRAAANWPWICQVPFSSHIFSPSLN